MRRLIIKTYDCSNWYFYKERYRRINRSIRSSLFQDNNINNFELLVWVRDHSWMPQARSPPTYENWSRTGGISITIITAVTYTDSRLAATSPRIRLAVPVPTPTTPTQPHRPLPVHTSELPEEVPLVLLIRIATSIVLNTVVSPTSSYRSTNDHPLVSYLICLSRRVRRRRTRIIKISCLIAIIILPWYNLRIVDYETFIMFID